MSKWELTDEQCLILQTKLADWFNKINIMTDEEFKNTDRKSIALDLYNSGFSPQHVRDSLCDKFGYEETAFDCNGWQWDFWIYFTKEKIVNRCDKLRVAGTGVTFELIVDIDD